MIRGLQLLHLVLAILFVRYFRSHIPRLLQNYLTHRFLARGGPAIDYSIDDLRLHLATLQYIVVLNPEASKHSNKSPKIRPATFSNMNLRLDHTTAKTSRMAKILHGERMRLRKSRSWQRSSELLRWPCRSEPSSPFLKLPTELRLEIFRYLLISEDPHDLRAMRTLCKLRNVSNQLAREAEDIYWSENIFRFHQYDAGPDLGCCHYTKWLRGIPKGCVTKVRKVSIGCPTRKTLFGPYHGRDYALASSTVVYNLDLTDVQDGPIVGVRYPSYHQEALGNSLYLVSYLDLSRVAQALFIRSGQICVTKRALMACFSASRMRHSSAVFMDILDEGEQVRRSRMIATLVSCSPSIDEYEDPCVTGCSRWRDVDQEVGYQAGSTRVRS